ncbi:MULTISPECIES: glucose 1-dehydrogenase [Mesorhizobium]|uniref:SDR family NAD(P)-dependent oxidoreductase n=1 Tax=Mesorhizobium sp. TaxID=1871066 RepID=UPI00049465A3|nr:MULTISPECIES: glucose 1-dehydrogenase [Mesorhizobium]RWM74529.1 MAG: glucose 1-dehydrogenase [Mesorhizobium sp.]TIO27861.1 MAG: glucose 1-dehydrogenase [Mesorhizobium sp.]TJV63429.1 MAG: glucose 1-dehydrogenase [Mesorhizobium sp.]
MSKLNGKIAIVTGASKGIGAGIAKGLAAAGAAVVVNYASSREGADRVVAEIMDAGGRAVAVHGDVSQAADVRRLFDAAKSSFGAVDILVNNAGVFAFEPLEAVTEAEFHREFDTNVLGTILTIREAVNHFGAEGGSVINISSVASLNPQPNSLVYAATKGAVDSITLSMSRELGARNIRVNAIAPGGVDTEGLQRIGIVGSEFEKQVIAMTPLGRFGQPDDIARIAVFLASDEASWLTGERITASGGWR